MPVRLPLHRPADAAPSTSARSATTASRKGLTTACCETCPTGARTLGDLKNPEDPIHEFLRDHKVQVLKPQMATGSKVYYNGLDGSVR